MFTGLANSLRSLTASPIGTLVDQAHRMARRRLESGGAANSKRSRGDDDAGESEFVLPSDVNPVLVAMAIHAKLGNTVLMITHDVDEAVLLADRVVMMTNGPRARIGQIIDVSSPRPRNRQGAFNDPELRRCRQAIRPP